MEVFIPLVIFWIVTSVMKGLQKEQQAQRGGPLPRPQPRPQVQEEKGPERPVRQRRERGTLSREEAPQEIAPPPVRSRPERAPRQARLMKEGETARPLSRLQEAAAVAQDTIAAQEQQVLETSPIVAKEKKTAAKGASLQRIRSDLMQPQNLQAAILYSEILGAPRSRRPLRAPLQER